MILLPCVSTGNVPQLAVDLLISTYEFELEATIPSTSFHPFVGPSDWPDDGRAAPSGAGIATAVQAYKRNSDTIIQVRAPPLARKYDAAVDDIVSWVEKQGVETNSSIIITSSNSGQRIDLPVAASGPDSIAEIAPTDRGAEEKLVAAGYIKEAMSRLPQANVVVIYTYEGDNIPGAKSLAAVIAKKLGYPIKPWVYPYSWRRLFGKDIPLGLEEGMYS